jgi:hypothetical protein
MFCIEFDRSAHSTTRSIVPGLLARGAEWLRLEKPRSVAPSRACWESGAPGIALEIKFDELTAPAAHP